ncbi:hypothetical protein RBH20_19425 [Haloarcula sp. H-GB4]|uniref:hypothetical protein n=1 Tax=Haloarcula sp. H-GB4 TaxID=3069755 RepID=UPI0027B83D32|nr:hypothetical protein [Haloarcula sp. H-GB4]MDQ2074703.1 hypothetical protein [Haloarcula sp. H-GB4]
MRFHAPELQLGPHAGDRLAKERFLSTSRRRAGIVPATAGTMDRRETRDSAERSAPSSE